MTKTHRPFVLITAFYSAGIMAGHYVPAGFGYSWLATGALLGAAFLSFHKPLVSAVCLLLAFTGLGMVMPQGRQAAAAGDIRYAARRLYGKHVALKGTVNTPVEERRAVNGLKTTFTLTNLEIETPKGWKKHSGTVLVNIFRVADARYGDRLQLNGKLHKPYDFSSGENFSYRDFLSRKGIHYILSVKKDGEARVLERGRGNRVRAASLALRGRLSGILAAYLSTNESGVMRAVLLGDRGGIPQAVRVLFIQTGTAHILAISGLHIGIVAGLFIAAVNFLPLGRRARYAAVITLLIGYAFFTGGRPSVVRAAIMLAVLLASFIVEREPDMVNTLCLAAFLILAYNPFNLFDIGFQLSFVCVFSIVYTNGVLNRLAGPRRQPPIGGTRLGLAQRLRGHILRSFWISMAVWIGAAGLIAYYFGIVTPVTVVANLLVVPLLTLIVPLGFCLLVLGAAAPVCAPAAAACLKLALNGMALLTYLFARAPFAFKYVSGVGIGHTGAYYFILLLVLACPWRKFPQAFKLLGTRILAVLSRRARRTYPF